jgi:hypothetical protein
MSGTRSWAQSSFKGRFHNGCSDRSPHVHAASRLDEVASIAPFGDRPGLVAYLCPGCNHTESLLIPVSREAKASTEFDEPQSVDQQQQQPQPDDGKGTD